VTGYDPAVDDDNGAGRRDGPDGATRGSSPILSTGTTAPVVDWASTHPGRNRIGEVAEGIVLAGIGARVAAFIVDAFLLGGLSIIIAVLMRKLIADQSTADVIAGVLSAAVAVAWFAVAWIGLRAATPGQRLASLRVVDADTLRPIEPARAITRSIILGAAINLLIVPTPIGQLLSVGVIVWAFALLGTALFDVRRQGLHDRWTRTLVVRPIGAATMPLTLGCFLIVLIVFISPFVIVTAAGPAIQQKLLELAPSTAP